ncbi:hypothetical protein N657DRAFT_685217 [Parathielavia appendiculata]|uniref:Uncharacterized protein n=1 Tax=Parathielavia appendiculata TaxID=2587402 RepID=A0AAN6TPV0_9PEZI|nr:hypothetical protein N657DRAFT_685217 [Parathielavia appendiculata]
MHSNAWVVDLPAIETHDLAAVTRPTECPFAIGQLPISWVGESFYIDCGKRHGAEILFGDRQLSLKKCIETCYYGKY